MSTDFLIAGSFRDELTAQFPDLDWDGIRALPGNATVQDVADWAIAVGVDADTVQRLILVHA